MKLDSRILAVGLIVAMSLQPDQALASESHDQLRPTSAPKLAYAKPSDVGMSESLPFRIDEVVRRSLEANETSGAVVLVARRGKIVHEQAYGWRSIIPQREPMTTDTLFDLASLTKCVATASAVMKLVEEGKIRLADPVKTYLPEWTNSPREKQMLAAYEQLRRFLRRGALRLEPKVAVTEDRSTSSLVLVKGAKEKPAQLWRRLWEEGQLRLSPKTFEELIAPTVFDREAVTLRHLLTHTAGLDPYDNYYEKFPTGHARRAIIADIAQRPLRSRPGEQFLYSDLGFILLGEIVERVSGMTLDQFCRSHIFGPLGMSDTMFNPPASLRHRVAPSEWRLPPQVARKALVREKYMIRGEVHDGNAFVQDGVSGHAGLFSTAHDLAVFAQMLLGQGAYGQARIFSPLTVRAMTSPQISLPDGTRRGFGWDIASDYASQRGDLFDSGFGHTGWTGTSLWIVPREELFIVILTNRCHPDGTGNVTALRAKIANVVAASIVEPGTLRNNPLEEECP